MAKAAKGGKKEGGKARRQTAVDDEDASATPGGQEEPREEEEEEMCMFAPRPAARPSKDGTAATSGKKQEREDVAGQKKSSKSKAGAGVEASQAPKEVAPRAEGAWEPLLQDELEERQFQALGLEGWLVAACASVGMKRPTDVQWNCIPPVLAGRNVLASAETGSGKTAAFALPILQLLAQDPFGVFALVLTPTRELAFQIQDQFAALGTRINLRHTVIVGGMDMMYQVSPETRQSLNPKPQTT